MSTLLVTGTNYANQSHTKEIFQILYTTIKENDIDVIIQGANKGVELISLMSSFFIREGLEDDVKKYKIVTVLEDSLQKCYNDKKNFVKEYSDEVIELGNEVSPNNNYESFKIKNNYMVDQCDCVVGIMSKDNSFSTGALAIKNVASKNNKLVEIFYLD
jgi:hypothetical protein